MMTQGGCSSDTSEMSAEEETPRYTLPTQNRFEIDDGRGNGWVVEGSRGKRKKLSSSINSECFSQLSQTEQLTCLFNSLNRNYEKINSIEQNQRKCLSDINTTQKSVDDVNKRVDRTEKFIDLQMRKLKMLSYKSIDLEARSRRNNVIFWGITEKTGQECQEIIYNFMANELDIDTREMCIERAHRLGSQNSNINRSKADPKRPIIVRFRDYTATDTIMDNAYMLKGTPFGVDRDYPKEIATARKKLYSSEEAKEARSRRLKVQVKYPAKLFIDGKMIKNQFPDWFSILHDSRVDDFELEEDNGQFAHCEWNPRNVSFNDQLKKDHDSNKTNNQSQYSCNTVIDDQNTTNVKNDSVFVKKQQNEKSVSNGNAHSTNVNTSANDVSRDSVHVSHREDSRDNIIVASFDNSPKMINNNSLPVILPPKLFPKHNTSTPVSNNSVKTPRAENTNQPNRKSRSESTRRRVTDSLEVIRQSQDAANIGKTQGEVTNTGNSQQREETNVDNR